MTRIPLGKLEKLDLRKVWSSEASDFTPWLAQEENLALLGDELELQLELETQERNVGLFRADILTQDINTQHWVLIENQIGKTEHIHLGQLITYAAGLKAVTIIWISSRFTEEHRAALDWLNEVTDEGINFFGLEVEAWRIGDSPVAPKFNVVSKPNLWSHSVSRAAQAIEEGSLSETRKLQLEYWTFFRTFLLSRKSIVKPQKPLPQHWSNYAIGKADIYLQAFANTKDNCITVGLILTGPNAKKHFRILLISKNEIEEQVGSGLDWRELPDKTESHIVLVNPNCSIFDRQKWDQYALWMAETLEKFTRTFKTRVKELNVDNETTLE